MIVKQLRQAVLDEGQARDGAGNLKSLIKEAKLTEYRKEADAMKHELKGARDSLSVLRISVTATEEQLAAIDEDAATKSKAAREEQMAAIRKRMKASRDSNSSFQSTSAVNVQTLQDAVPRNKARVDAALARREQLIQQLLAEPNDV